MTADGWVIDRDYLSHDFDGCESRVGYGMVAEDAEASCDGLGRRNFYRTGLKASEVTEPIRFRALDDDGEVYYGGVCTADWLLGEDDFAYLIQRWVEADAGATDVQFRAEDCPESFVETHRKCGASVTSGGTEWLIVYG